MKRLIGKPSPAMIVACVALLLALTGTSIAAIGNNSVGADELAGVKQRSHKKLILAGSTDQTKAKCKRGEQLLGGGARFPGADPAEFPSVEQNGPITNRAWFAVANNDDSLVDATLRVTALCLQK